jgi:hypothetical protein
MADTILCECCERFTVVFVTNGQKGTSLVVGSLIMHASRLLHDRDLLKWW